MMKRERHPCPVHGTRNAKWKGSRCDKMLERKPFGKIEAIPEAVW